MNQFLGVTDTQLVTDTQFYKVQYAGIMALGFRCKSSEQYNYTGHALELEDPQGKPCGVYWVAWEGWHVPVIEPKWNVIALNSTSLF